MANNVRNVKVSDHPEVQFQFEIIQIQGRIELFPRGWEKEGSQHTAPGVELIRRGTTYVMLYDNYPAADGLYELAIYETRAPEDPNAERKRRHRMGPRHFQRSRVMKYMFRLVTDPSRRAPRGV
jgi:hypothetical protein